MKNRKSKYHAKAKNGENSLLFQEIRKIGWKDLEGKHIWFMELIEAYPCKNRRELLKREGHYQKIYFKSHTNLILNQRIEGDDRKIIQKRAAEKYKEAHPDRVRQSALKTRETNKDKYNAYKREKITCKICGEQVSRNSMNDHQKSQKCQQMALSLGMITEIKEFKKKTYITPTAKQEYDRARYFEKKNNGYYETKKTGPRKYLTCTWVLLRNAKDGRKKGDLCGKKCSSKLFEGKAICGMHRRVIRNKRKKEEKVLQEGS
jgi:hypothetical protein